MGLTNVVSLEEFERIIQRFQIKYKAGMTISVRMVELTIPPIIGAAMRFMTSAPVPVVHMNQKRFSAESNLITGFI